MKNISLALRLCCLLIFTAFAACTSSSSSQLAITKDAKALQQSTLVPTQVRSDLTSSDCSRDTEPVAIAPGWKLLWHHAFEQPIATPPITDGGQILLVKRNDPRPKHQQDTVLAINPETGNIQWQIADAKSLYVDGIEHSTKYWLLVVSYLRPDPLGNPHPEYHDLVIDPLSGQIVYDSGALSDREVMGTAISDEALLSRYDYAYLRRIDLPSGASRWVNPLREARNANGLFVIDNWLYLFSADQNVYEYSLADGTLVRTASIGIVPNSNDVLVQGQDAVVRSWEKIVRFDLRSMSSTWVSDVSYLIDTGSNAFWNDQLSMTLTPDAIYLFDAQDNLLKIDWSTGQTLWSSLWPGFQAMSRPVIIQGLVYGLFADGTLRAFSDDDGKSSGIVMKVPIWYWKSDDHREFLDLAGGLGVSGNTLIITTGCSSVYAIQREP